MKLSPLFWISLAIFSFTVGQCAGTIYYRATGGVEYELD